MSSDVLDIDYRDDSTIDIYKILTQDELNEIAASKAGQEATEICIQPSTPLWTEHVTSQVLDLNAVKFPNLKKLEICYQPLKALNMSGEHYPCLEEFKLEQPSGPEIQYMDLRLPELKIMTLESVNLGNPEGLGKSLSHCPKLESFTSYKLFGMGKVHTHTLVLPRCTNLDFYRSDTLRCLKIWAPKLQCLNLRACYNIGKVDILDHRPPDYTGDAYNFDGVESKYMVSFINTHCPGGNVTSHKRCAEVDGDSDSDQI